MVSVDVKHHVYLLTAHAPDRLGRDRYGLVGHSVSKTGVAVAVRIARAVTSWLFGGIQVPRFGAGDGVCRFGPAPVKRYAGKQRDLGSNPLRLSSLFQSCGLWTLSCDFVPHN